MGCSGSKSGSEDHLPPGMHYVRYEVSLSPDEFDEKYYASITYIDENGKTVNLSSVTGFEDNNWTYTFSATSGTKLYLSAKIIGNMMGTIHSDIYVDSNMIQDTLSHMPEAPATAEYTIPSD
jgi:hypothetical protein